MKIYLYLLCVFFSVLCASSYEQTFKKYLEVSGSQELLFPDKQYIERIYGEFLPQDAEITKAQQEALYELIARTIQATIAESLPYIQTLYQQYFSESELQEIIAFYQTPLGKKLAKNLAPMQEQTLNIVLKVMQKHLAGMGAEITKILAQE